MSPENKNVKKKKKLKEKKKRPVEFKGESNFDFDSTLQETLGKKKKKTKKKKIKSELDSKKKTKGSGVDSKNSDGVEHEDSDGDRKGTAMEKKSKLGLKKRRRREMENDIDASIEDRIHRYEHADGGRPKNDHAKSSNQFETSKEDGSSERPTKASNGTKTKTKWLMKYKESRPGLNILQERIDDFITAYEERQEQERNEREARAAEGGWTVVVHHKGRKKTTEAETGVAVGSVAQAAVVDKMVRKKSKEVPLDFYRFKKREAQRNEIMMKHNKFEQDKKRIQQLRSARKFRPY